MKVRGREWIALPQSERIRPHRSCGFVRWAVATARSPPCIWPLEGGSVTTAEFAPPDPAQSGSQSSALLLRDALLLKLRAGAGPFRSLGNVALEPRAYQLVPLLMALKQAVTRVLIADEVGLGKTVEALLIARELLDRGEIRQVTVICPPHLCEKWRQDMASQFNLSAEVVRPGTRPAGAGAAGRPLDLRGLSLHGGEPGLDQERTQSGGIPALLRQLRDRR